jgi:hypothetical protein
MLDADEPSKATLELGVVSASSQPPIKAGIDHRHQLFGINQFAGRGYGGLSWLERLCAPVGSFEFSHKIENGFTISGLSKATHSYPLNRHTVVTGIDFC